MSPIEVFHTNRLIAARVRESDYAVLCAMHSDTTTMATLGGVRSDEVTHEFLHEKMEHWETYGHGTWMFREKQNRRFIGRGLLEHIDVGGYSEVEVGYSVVASDWGKGLATEMARAIVSIGFSQLTVDSIVGFTYPDNYASRRVMEKVGFTLVREIDHVGRPCVLYRIMREAYSGRPEIRLQNDVCVID